MKEFSGGEEYFYPSPNIQGPRSTQQLMTTVAEGARPRNAANTLLRKRDNSSLDGKVGSQPWNVAG